MKQMEQAIVVPSLSASLTEMDETRVGRLAPICDDVSARKREQED